MNRFDYLDRLLESLDSKAIEKIHYITLMLDDEDYIRLKSGETIQPQIDLKSQPYLQEWIGPEIGIWKFHIYSENMKQLFLAGDKNAIFEFCCNTTMAFRANWVLETIERWKDENTKESLKNLKEIIKAYTNSRGKSLRELLTELLIRDHDVYKYVLTQESSGDNNKTALNKAAREFYLSYESVREIYFSFQKYYKKIVTMRSNFRGIIIGFPKEMPDYDEIDPILEDIFGLRSFVDSLGTQVIMYKMLRKQYCNLKYQDGVTVERKENPTHIKAELDDVFTSFCQKHYKERFWIEEMYNDFLIWEILRNYDSGDIAAGLSLKITDT